MKTKSKLTGLVMALALVSAACSDSNDPDLENVVEVARENGFTTLIDAVEAAGLTATLEGAGPFTVFAPTDAAFAALPAGTLEALLADPAALTEILLYHVIDGQVNAADLNGVVSAETLNGLSVLFDLSSGVRVNDATVTQADVAASNGVIHVIDAVLLPPSANIVDVAVGTADFSTLVTALQEASLDATLAGPGPFTVFAPTNAAFDALPAGTLEALLADPDALEEVLLYHVASGLVFAGDLDGSPITTLQGSNIDVTVDGGVQVNESNVTSADILTTNGVIHVIDAVLLPPTS